MNTLLVMSDQDSIPYMMTMVRSAARQYKKACYISFNNSYDMVLDLLGRAVPGVNMFVVIDSSPKSKESKEISKMAYTVPVTMLFDVYLFLRKLIMDEGIEYLLVDSLSTLIRNNSDLPLTEMMTSLLLEVGKLGCDVLIAVEQADEQHPVVKSLLPLVKKQLYL